MSARETQYLGRRPANLFVAALCLVLAACSEPPLQLSEWEPEWRAAVEAVTSLEAHEITIQECEEVLVFLREQRPVLSPAPHEDLDGPMDSWFSRAEDAFFECEFSHEIESERPLFRDLRSYEAAIDEVLARSG